jgi:hypothetical protein
VGVVEKGSVSAEMQSPEVMAVSYNEASGCLTLAVDGTLEVAPWLLEVLVAVAPEGACAENDNVPTASDDIISLIPLAVLDASLR